MWKDIDALRLDVVIVVTTLLALPGHPSRYQGTSAARVCSPPLRAPSPTPSGRRRWLVTARPARGVHRTVGLVTVRMGSLWT